MYCGSLKLKCERLEVLDEKPLAVHMARLNYLVPGGMSLVLRSVSLSKVSEYQLPFVFVNVTMLNLLHSLKFLLSFAVSLSLSFSLSLSLSASVFVYHNSHESIPLKICKHF